jgi:3-dehydroquinate dehydratase/shikimate dehydrogenase
VPLVESLSEAAGKIGAVNTLVKTSTGWHGDNTDGAGFLEPLTHLQPELKSATVIGTGGSARAVVWALVEAGVQVLVLGRRLAKAQELAQSLGAQSALLDEESLPLMRKFSQVIVQTTNVGMGTMEGQDPLPWYTFSGSEIVYDIIYAPARTAFLLRAGQAGCRLLFGRQMLEHQAWRQFRLFTGQAHPGARTP